VKIQKYQSGAVGVVRLDGPILGDDTEAFKADLLAAARDHLGRVVLDASGLTFVDSQGLEALLDVTEELGDSGHALKLCALNQTVRHVLELTGLSAQFEFYADTNAAVRSFL